ncbi:HD-like signal output (HDOD) domain, no enzymatic activity [Noviherbaspirillum humi]|uniref:histidine kinase n=1 Tax=Noviherbaspirillum humi TaxID=1688639 RepID=A0A239LZX9_9BURK|nr:HDOD domain-containing protein [Noviherbaspirillum humi]SNT36056.1 HD-like signal output (HDOD) domain, no enzymatic activity [Noviherbaspirillum humi]
MNAPTPELKSRLLAARLPSLPQALIKLMQACADDDVGMKELGQLVAQDAALAARVLQVASSPAYHHGGHPAGIDQALATMGLDMVRTLLLTQSVYQTFQDPGGAGLDLRAFWIHAISAGLTARMLAQRQGYPNTDEAYLAGLLHDIGRLALVSALPEKYAANFHAEEDGALCALEERTLEITHAEAGALMMERLALDSFLADSIRYHHAALPRLQDAHPLVRIVAGADRLLNMPSEDGPARAGILAATGLSEGDHRKHQASLAVEVKRVADMLGIELPPPAPAQAAAAAIAARAASAADNPLQDSMRDLLLIEKTLAGLRRQGDAESCVRAIVKAAIILFDFSDAVVLAQAPGARALMPTALPPGRQRLAGLSLPASDDNLAGRVARHGRPALLAPPAQPSVAEEQLLRFFQAEALVALRVQGADDRPLVLVGATSALQATRLAQRLALLQEFGGQAGAVLAAAGGAGAAAASEQDFRLAARRVAHEVSNPLAIIRNYLGVLQKKAESAEPISAELGTIEEELDRVGRIVHDFAQPERAVENAREASCDVNAALIHVARMFIESGSLPNGLQIARHVSPEPALAAIDEGSLRQVLLNLVKNAVEAMPHGGRIDLRNNGMVERDGSSFIAVAVSDTGPGIPDSVRARLFQPVASDKDGANRGIGLSIVHDLLRRHRAHIACRSSRGGTSFDMLLPAYPGPAAAALHQETK